MTGYLRLLRFLPAVLLITGAFGSLAPVSPVLAATITGCPMTEGALQTAIANAGAGGTVRFACSSPDVIYFDGSHGGSGPITMSQDVTLDASSSIGSVTFDGGSAVQLFVVNSGVSLTLDTLTLQHASPTCSPVCDIYGGVIDNEGGTVNLTDSTVSRNSASCSASPGACTIWGGVIYNNRGTLNITDSTFSDNSPSCTASSGACTLFGGLIENTGSVTITDSTFSVNSASCTAAPGACTVFGGIIESTTTLTITTSTFSGNSPSCTASTTTNSSACSVFGEIHNAGTLTLTNSTLAGNSTTCSKDLTSVCSAFDGVIENDGTMSIGATIIANNTGGNCGGAGTVNDWGYNLTDDDGSGCHLTNPTDTLNANPDLGPLANNGGPTETMALLPGSPAIDQIPLNYDDSGAAANLCPASGTDQRGYPRPDAEESVCDIGSYEHQDNTVLPSGETAYDIESSNWSCSSGGTACIPMADTDAGQCVTMTPCPGATYGDVEAFGSATNATNGIPDELILACVQGTNTGYRIGYLDVVSNQGNLDYPAGNRSAPGVYGTADLGAIGGKGTLLSGGGGEDNPSQPSSVNASAYDLTTGVRGSAAGTQNTDNGTNTLNNGSFRVTITGKLWTVTNGQAPVRNTTSSTISCMVGGLHAYDLKNQGLDSNALAEGELENALGDNFFLPTFAPLSSNACAPTRGTSKVGLSRAGSLTTDC